MLMPLPWPASGPPPFAGEAVCLSASLIWAFTIHLFRRPVLEHGPRAVNLIKCIVSGLLFGATVIALGRQRELLSLSVRDALMLAGSGLIGLAVGDSALFAALPRLGIHRTQLIQTLAPVFTTIFAVAWLGESFGVVEATGTALILMGVGAVVARPEGHAPPVVEALDATLGAGPTMRRTARPGSGAGFAVLAALCQALGVLLSKDAMERVPILTASLVRMTIGALGLIVLGLADGGLRRGWAASRSRATMARLLPATFLGSYVGIMLMMAGIAWAPASIAAFLLATTPVFTLIIGAASGREPLSWRGVAATAATLAGCGVLAIR